jgi:hypothetical protein
MKKAKTRGPTEKELRIALSKIASMGNGLKPDVIDWERIGKQAVQVANEVFRQRCAECGK